MQQLTASSYNIALIRLLSVTPLGLSPTDSNWLVWTHWPHWNEMWHKVEFSMGKPSAYTRTSSQNLPTLRIRGIRHIELSVFHWQVFVFWQSLDWIVLCPKVEFTVRNTSAYIRANGQSLLSPWNVGSGTLHCLFPSAEYPSIGRGPTESHSFQR